ncbi:MAG: DUF11 domain-containing protein [Litorimonas sp.]
MKSRYIIALAGLLSLTASPIHAQEGLPLDSDIVELVTGHPRSVARIRNPIGYCIAREVEDSAMAGVKSSRRAANRIINKCNIAGPDFDKTYASGFGSERLDHYEAVDIYYPVYYDLIQRQKVNARILPEVDLVTVKTVEPNTFVRVGDIVRFDITITNNADIPVNNVILEDDLPEELTPTADNGRVTSGQYDLDSSTWVLETLGSGQTASLTLEGTVNIPLQAGISGEVTQQPTENTNTISVEGAGVDEMTRKLFELTNKAPAANSDPSKTTPIFITNTTSAATSDNPDGNTAGDILSVSIELLQ